MGFQIRKPGNGNALERTFLAENIHEKSRRRSGLGIAEEIDDIVKVARARALS
jgi:hypothetical protein